MTGQGEEMANNPRDGPPQAKRFNPDQYLRQISKHAATTLQNSLYQGGHFKNLDVFLEHSPRAKRVSISSEKKEDEEQLAILYKLNSDEQPPVPETLARPFFPPTHLQPDETGVIFLRGYQYARSLLELGAAYNVDPEFYRRHLSFLGDELFNIDTTLLPSYKSVIFHLTLTTIGHHITRQYESLLEKRRECATQMNAYLSGLHNGGFPGRSWKPVESVVRSFAVHNLEEFSLQQVVSIYVSHNNNPSGDGTWKAVIWTDGGAELRSSPSGPWNNTSENVYFDPIPLYKPGIALRSHQFPRHLHYSHERHSIDQRISLLPIAFGRTLHPQIMREDPFYAFSEIFTFFAASEMQFLNAIERLVRRSSKQLLEIFPQSLSDFQIHSDLSYFRTLLDDHIETITETNNFVKNRHNLRWPRSNSNKALRATISLQNDIQALLDRAVELRESCMSGINMSIQNLQIGEARKGFHQAKLAHNLAILATLFLPITATATIFGMNFVQFPSMSQGIWVWILVTLPFLIVFFAVLRWDLHFGRSNKVAW